MLYYEKLLLYPEGTHFAGVDFELARQGLDLATVILQLNLETNPESIR